MSYTDYIVPIIILTVFVVAIIRKVNIFDEFIAGAEEGLKTSFEILPALILLMTCVGVFKASGGQQIFSKAILPFTDMIGFPEECTPLIFIRPLSGSGALGVFDSIISQYGPDSFPGRIAATMMGSTETTFYTVAVYFGAVKIRKTRYAIPAALVGDLTGFIASAIVVRLMF